MTDDETREGDDAGDDSAEARAGERLAAARREKQISVAEIAKELHIDEYKVRALERNDFEVLGAPVFAKGHLRKYSQLVGVRIEDVLADYYALNRSVGMPPLVGHVRPSTREINLGRWLVVLLLLAVAGIAWWWFIDREAGPARAPAAESGRVSLPPADPADADTAPGDSAPGAEPASGAELPAPAGEPPVQQESAAATAMGAPTASPTTEPAAARQAAPGDVRLTLDFSGDCWTEITDASGDRLFFGLGSDGRQVDVSGPPPLSVMFGNADNVTVEVDGGAYPIPAGSRRGRIARFSIQAP